MLPFMVNKDVGPYIYYVTS